VKSGPAGVAADALIRISTQDDGRRLSVAGDLVGEWAGFLERECAERLGSVTPFQLELSELKRVDGTGIEVLRRLKKRGAQIVRCPRVVLELIGE
jgi:ABC-type transporter Mla MlaB component